MSSVSFKFLPEMSDSTEIPSPPVKATGGRTPTEIRHTELHDPLESLEVLQRIAFMIFESSSPEGTPGNRAPSPSTAIGSFWWNSIFPLRSRKMRRFFPATLTVSPFDLAQYRYANDRGKLDQDVASLKTQKRVRQHRLMGRQRPGKVLVSRADEGGQACPRAVAPAAIYRMYQAEANQIAKQSGVVRRVVTSTMN